MLNKEKIHKIITSFAKTNDGDMDTVCLLRALECELLENLGTEKEELMEAAREQFSVTDLSTLLDEKEEVFACQIWQKEDLKYALKQAGHEPTEEHVGLIAENAKSALEDCTPGWETLDAVIDYFIDKEPEKQKEEKASGWKTLRNIIDVTDEDDYND